MTWIVWLGLGVAIGLRLGEWWAVMFALAPWPLQMGVGLLIGRYALLGESWEVIALLTFACGGIGVLFGVAATQFTLEDAASWRCARGNP